MKSQGADDLFEGVKNFVQGLGLPTTLTEIDIRLSDENRRTLAAETLRMVLIKNNPRTTAENDCVQLLEEMA